MTNEILELITESYEVGNITLEEAQILSEAVNKKALAIGGGLGAAAGIAASGAALYNKKKKEKARLKAEMDRIEEEKKKEEEKALKAEINNSSSSSDIKYKDLHQAKMKNKLDVINDSMVARRNARIIDNAKTNKITHGLDNDARRDDYTMMDVKRALDRKITDDMYQTKELERKSRLADAKNELELQKINVEIQEVLARISSTNTPPSKIKSLKDKLKILLKKKEKLEK